MQVTSNPIHEKQTGLERQVRSKEVPASNSHSIQSTKIEEHGSDRGAAQNETSQYLKVLSRVENLLIQNKLPDAAIDGFAGAVKKQIDAMSEEDRQMLLKLPEMKTLELNDLDDIPEMIKNNIKNEEKNTALLKFLRLQEFADLMRTDNKPASQIYTANSAQPSVKSEPSPVNILDIPKVYEKPPLTNKPTTGENLVNSKRPGVTKLMA